MMISDLRGFSVFLSVHTSVCLFAARKRRHEYRAANFRGLNEELNFLDDLLIWFLNFLDNFGVDIESYSERKFTALLLKATSSINMPQQEN